MKKYKRVVFFEIGIESKTLEKMKKSTWKAIIKEKSEERMNREIQQKTTTMKKLRFLRGAHANESQYVKYCGMEETTKLLKLRLNMIKFDSNYGKKGTCKKVAETMEHMLECKEAKKIIGGITGSETIMSENKEELMTIYNYMERILKTLK